MCARTKEKNGRFSQKKKIKEKEEEEKNGRAHSCTFTVIIEV